MPDTAADLRQQLMFLRNAVHGAPIPRGRLVVRLLEIDQLLNETQPNHERRLPVKGVSYYEDVADRIQERA